MIVQILTTAGHVIHIDSDAAAFERACDTLIDTGVFYHRIGANYVILPERAITYVRTIRPVDLTPEQDDARQYELPFYAGDED